MTPLLQAERIKDIVTIKGERGNPLFGFGLVIGLDGTGDGSAVTKQAVASVLRQMNMSFTASDIDAANVASVFVTAHLGPFDRKGAYLDVAVSTIGGASSLQGGKLLMTNLLGADRRTYAIAQGSLALGGFGASGSNATVKKGHLTAGTIPNGAIVEREEIGSIVHNNEIMLLLRNPDHATDPFPYQPRYWGFGSGTFPPDGSAGAGIAERGVSYRDRVPETKRGLQRKCPVGQSPKEKYRAAKKCPRRGGEQVSDANTRPHQRQNQTA